MEAYNGRCPMCSGQLNVDGEKIQCVNGDYESLRAKLELRWHDYEQDVASLNKYLHDHNRMSDFEDMRAEQIEQLFKDLQELNTK